MTQSATTMPAFVDTAAHVDSLVEQLWDAAAKLHAHMEQIERFQAEYLGMMRAVKADIESMQYFIEDVKAESGNALDDTTGELFDTMEELYGAVYKANENLYDCEYYVKSSTRDVDADCDAIANLLWHACVVDIPVAIGQLTKLK